MKNFLNRTEAIIQVMNAREELFCRRIEARRRGDFREAKLYEAQYDRLEKVLKKLVDGLCIRMKNQIK